MRQRVLEVLRRHAGLWLPLLLALWLFRDGFLGICLDWDETNVLAIAMLPLDELFRMVAVRYHHPPGFLLIIKVWSLLWGASDLSLRVFALLAGLSGVVASYVLALRLSGKRRVGVTTALMVAASPLVIRYAGLATPYSLAYAGTLFSWYFILQLPEALKQKSAFRSGVFWAYVVSTLVAIQTFATAFLFLGFQGLWLIFTQRNKLSAENFRVLMASGLMLALSNLPLVILFLQPWYIAHSSDLQSVHPFASFPMFLFTPANVLFFGYDIRDLWLLVRHPLSVYITWSVAVIALLAAGFKSFRRSAQEKFLDNVNALMYLGVYPLIATYLLSIVSHVSIFHIRTVLYSGFIFFFLLSWLLVVTFRDKRKWMLWGVVALIVFAQAFSPYRRMYFEKPNCFWVSQLKAAYQPETDGLVLDPGWSHLSFLRYLAPKEFGLTKLERESDPRKENIFHMVQRMDDRYFFISGEDTWLRPDVQIAFQAFQKKHARIWLLARSPGVVDLLDCQREYRVLDQVGNFVPWRCDPTSVKSGIRGER